MAVERAGVSFEPELLEKFDRLIEEQGYENRSEAIRDLVRKALNDAEVKEEKGEVIGTLTFVYDHHAGNVAKKLQHFQHEHLADIISTTHIHVDHHNCLEVLIVKGSAGEVRKLAHNIIAIKGVDHGELVVIKASL